MKSQSRVEALGSLDVRGKWERGKRKFESRLVGPGWWVSWQGRSTSWLTGSGVDWLQSWESLMLFRVEVRAFSVPG